MAPLKIFTGHFVAVVFNDFRLLGYRSTNDDLDSQINLRVLFSVPTTRDVSPIPRTRPPLKATRFLFNAVLCVMEAIVLLSHFFRSQCLTVEHTR